MNKVILIGRIATEIQSQFTANGIAYTKFHLAVDRAYSKKNAQNGDPTADFVPCIGWRENAKTIGNYCNKGMRIMVEGHLQIDTFIGENRMKNQSFAIIIERFEFLDSRKDSNKQNHPQTVNQSNSYNQQNQTSQNQSNVVNYQNQNNSKDYVPPEQLPF
ncbi:MAG: single-stranded DNA-binding protein [Selenomonadaceae bacterium]|nr:single-stranded DNA-binding protein [Selenomonadaceae bacterium]